MHFKHVPTIIRKGVLIQSLSERLNREEHEGQPTFPLQLIQIANSCLMKSVLTSAIIHTKHSKLINQVIHRFPHKNKENEKRGTDWMGCPSTRKKQAVRYRTSNIVYWLIINKCQGSINFRYHKYINYQMERTPNNSQPLNARVSVCAVDPCSTSTHRPTNTTNYSAERRQHRKQRNR